MNPTRNFLKVAFLSLSLIVVSACSNDASSAEKRKEDTFLDSSAVKSEYVTTAEALTWPGTGGFSDYENGPSGEGDFQRGVGEGDAVMAWNCAWAKEWLTVRGKDPKAEQIALDQYKAITETNTFSAYFAPDLQKYFHEVIEAADLGDPSLVQRDVEINCP